MFTYSRHTPSYRFHKHEVKESLLWIANIPLNDPKTKQIHIDSKDTQKFPQAEMLVIISPWYGYGRMEELGYNSSIEDERINPQSGKI